MTTQQVERAFHCAQKDVPAGSDWLAEVKKHEAEVLSRRS